MGRMGETEHALSGNPQRRETLGEGGKLTFEPNEQNRRVISEIRERIPRTEKEKGKKDALRNLRSLLKREDLVQTDTHM